MAASLSLVLGRRMHLVARAVSEQLPVPPFRFSPSGTPLDSVTFNGNLEIFRGRI